jgi:hypothetical protein
MGCFWAWLSICHRRLDHGRDDILPREGSQQQIFKVPQSNHLTVLSFLTQNLQNKESYLQAYNVHGQHW